MDGKRYMDCLSAYSAVNQGHCHPRILQALQEQAARVALTSRAFRNDQLPRFAAELARLCGMEMVLPMNTGAEAVETAITRPPAAGDTPAKASEKAITPNTCAFLFEPIQCEAGILIPPDGYVRDVTEICRRERVLLVADEIQTGLGRTGCLLACQNEGVQPDVFILGKALSGGGPGAGVLRAGEGSGPAVQGTP